MELELIVDIIVTNVYFLWSHSQPLENEAIEVGGFKKSAKTTMTKVLLITLLLISSTVVLIQCQDSELATCTYCHHVIYLQ